jgi:hypothetical protein
MAKVLKTQKAVHAAIESLDEIQAFVINHLFGLNSCSATNYEEIAELLSKKLSPEQLFAFNSKPNPNNDKALISADDIKEIEANALRALAYSATKSSTTMTTAGTNSASAIIKKSNQSCGVTQAEGESEPTDNYNPHKNVKIKR